MSGQCLRMRVNIIALWEHRSVLLCVCVNMLAVMTSHNFCLSSDRAGATRSHYFFLSHRSVHFGLFSAEATTNQWCRRQTSYCLSDFQFFRSHRMQNFIVWLITSDDLSVTRLCCAKTAKRIEMLFRVATLGDRRHDPPRPEGVRCGPDAY